MGTMLFIAFIVSISLLIYYSITRDQKVFVDKVLASLNEMDARKTDASQLFIVGTKLEFMLTISVFKDEIAISRIDKHRRIIIHSYYRSQIDSIVVNRDYFKIQPKDKVSIIDDVGNDFIGHTEMGLRTLRRSKVSLFKIFTQIGVAEELSRSLVAAGYSVTEQMPKSSLVKKIMIGVAMVKAVY